MRRSIAVFMLSVAVIVTAFATSSFQNSNGNTQANANRNGNANANTNANTSNQNGNTNPSEAGDPNIKVWVNKSSHVYHCPASRYYGKTKNGEYMTQKEAQDAGNHAAGGKNCQ